MAWVPDWVPDWVPQTPSWLLIVNAFRNAPEQPCIANSLQGEISVDCILLIDVQPANYEDKRERMAPAI